MSGWMIRAVGLLAAVAAGAGAADWPNFRGPNHDGISPETGINKDWKAKAPEVVWKATMSDGGYAGPAAAGGIVFIIDHKGEQDIVRAIDIEKGADVWTHTYADSPNANHGFARSTPAIEGGKVYTVSRLGLVNCLDAKAGTPAWSRNVVTEFKGRLPDWQMSMSPLIDGKMLILCPGGPGAGLVALDKTTGKTIWQGGGDDKMGYATPVAATLHGKKQYLVFNGSAATGVDAADGNVLWRYPWKTSYDVNAAVPIAIGDTVFITSGYGHGAALLEIAAGGTVKPKWESKELVAHFNSAVLHGGYLYGIGDPGFLLCMDPKDGSAKWKKEGFEKGGLVVVDGTIIAMDGRGGAVVMAALTPTEYKELGRITPLGGQSWTAPIVAGGKLIVRSKSALACLNLKQE